MKRHIQDFNRFSMNEGITPGEGVYATDLSGDEWHSEEHLMDSYHVAVADRDTVYYIWNPDIDFGDENAMSIFHYLSSTGEDRSNLTIIRPIQNKEIVKVFGIEALNKLMDKGEFRGPKCPF